MKLLVLSHVSDYIGGAEKSLLEIIDTWLRDDPELEVKFIIRKPLRGIEAELDRRKIPYHSLDYTYWSDSNLPDTPDRIYGNAKRNMKAIRDIETVIDSFKPNIVLTNSIIAPWAALAAHYKGIPHVWMVREYGERDHGRSFEIGESKTFSDIGNLSELVLTNSLTLADFVASYVDKNKISTVYTPFNLSSIRKKSKEGVDSVFKSNNKKVLKVVLTGNIARGKGQHLLVEAIGILSTMGIEAEACFIGRAGNTELTKELQSLAASYGVTSSLHFVGFQKNPLAIIKQADIAVMASRMEAFGRVTFEYAALGLPVVGSNSGATPEIVEDGKTGLLYEPNNAKDLAEKLATYAKSPELVKQHGSAAVSKTQDMMSKSGPFSAGRAYAKVKLLVGAKKTKFTSLNYTHRWMSFPDDAAAYMQYVQTAPLKRVLVFRVKNYLRPFRSKAREIYSKIRKSS